MRKGGDESGEGMYRSPKSVNIEIDKIVGNRVFMNKIWNGTNFFIE